MPSREISWAPRREVFRAISPDSLGAFLIRRGWVRKPTRVALMRYFELPGQRFDDGAVVHYYFPDADTSDEYPSRVRECVENFARYYDLDPYAILAELQGGPVAEPVQTPATA
jgi:hypothetical protein